MLKYLNALNLTNHLIKRVKELYLSMMYTRDEEFNEKIFKLLEKKNLFISDMWIESAFGAKTHSMNLKETNLLSLEFEKQLNKNEVFINPSTYLYTHQFEALNISNRYNNPSIVITAPTGTGKTEAFLLPMLNELFKKERNESKCGVRSIILYPMNALVADQNKRLFDWLKGQSRVKMFFYNSETPEEKASGEFIDECFIQTRKEARENPPDILITNYSMLEYILARPQDYNLIGNALESIIVDEAHLYTSSLASEVALLLRRICLKANVQSSDLLTIATSATMSENKNEIKEFFSKFFNKSKESIFLIQGEREYKSIYDFYSNPENDLTLNEEEEVIDKFSDKNMEIILKESDEKLFLQYSKSKLFDKVNLILHREKLLNAPSFVDKLFIHSNLSKNEKIKILFNILTIGAKARLSENELPLTPHKLHLVSTSINNISECINCHTIYDSEKIKCPKCSSPTIKVLKCQDCDELIYGYGIKNNKLIFQRSNCNQYLSKKGTNESIYFTKEGREGNIQDKKYSIKFYKYKECPNCKSENIFNLGISDKLMLPILAEVMTSHMPEINKEYNIFLPAKGKRLLVFSDSRKGAARLGPLLTQQHEIQLFRRILMQTLIKNENQNDKLTQLNQALEQLKNLPALKDNYQLLLQERDALLKGLPFKTLIEELKSNKILGEFYDRKSGAKEEANENKIEYYYRENLKIIKEKLLIRVAREIITPNIKGINLEALGLLQLNYPNLNSIDLNKIVGVSELIIEIGESAFNKINNNLEKILNLYLYLFRSRRAITLKNENLNREIAMQGLGFFVVFGGDGYGSFNLEVKSDKSIFFRFTKRLLLSYGIEANLEQINIFLKYIFKIFTTIEFAWIEKEKKSTYDQKVIDGFRIIFDELSISLPKNCYLNGNSKHIWFEEINGIVPEKEISEESQIELLKVTQSDLDKFTKIARNRDLYKNGDNSIEEGLWADEHSAQLDSKNTRNLQNLFILGKRNILSATTTLEVGIDIGGLSGVLMANIPPTKTNYLQRAGRSGRRVDGSSIVLSYASKKHFDQKVYEDFSYYLNKSFKPLTITLEKEKIAIRHFHSLLLTKFYENEIKLKKVNINNSFKEMGYFCGLSMPTYQDTSHTPYLDNEVKENSFANEFLKFLNEFEIDNFIDEIDIIFKDTPTLKNSDYQKLLNSSISKYKNLIEKFIKEFFEYIDDWEKATSVAERNAIRYSLKPIYQQSIIEFFSNTQFLPKYGFPVDVRNLRVINQKESENKKLQQKEEKREFNFQRNSILALYEYAPGSKIVAGGKTIISRGLLKHYSGKNYDESLGVRGYLHSCKNEHFFKSRNIEKSCIIDGCKARVDSKPYLMPKHGFTTAKWDELNYTIEEPKQVGNFEIKIDMKEFSDFTSSKILGFDCLYKEGAKVNAINRGEFKKGFCICTTCGYSESESDKNNKLPKSFLKHRNLKSDKSSYKECLKPKDETSVLRHQNLIAEITTDILLLKPTNPILKVDLAETIANALHLAGVELIGIDERELSTTIIKNGKNHEIVIYDNNSGGSGYVFDLVNYFKEEWLKKAKEILYVNEQHHQECKYGCIKCIVTLNTKEYLPREKAYEYFDFIK